MKKLTLMAAVIFSLSSCVVYESHTVTGNPIGTKVGVAVFLIPFYKTVVTGE